MRTKIVKRHFCEHCGKGSFQIPTMMKHESRCCRNPKRACGVCECMETDVEANARVLIKDGIESLKTETDNCPACMLAAHIAANRLSGYRKGFEPEPGTRFFYYESFKDDLKNWMTEKRREENSYISGGNY